MKKTLKSRKLHLNRETLRQLATPRMHEVAGGLTSPIICKTNHCTEGSYCFQCITVDATDCPQCFQ